MKLRNKKTGEIVDFGYLQSDYIAPLVLTTHENDKPEMYLYNSLAELNAEWEDYEEPKQHWCVTMYGGITRIKDDEEPIDDLIEIGNYFNSKEDAYNAWEKLKAVKLLKDEGCSFDGWNVKTASSEGDHLLINLYVKDCTRCEELLNLLFGGEE